MCNVPDVIKKSCVPERQAAFHMGLAGHILTGEKCY